jgi:hypothetical protein
MLGPRLMRRRCVHLQSWLEGLQSNGAPGRLMSLSIQKSRSDSKMKRLLDAAEERADLIFCEHEGLTKRSTMRSSQFSHLRAMEVRTSVSVYFRFLAYHLLYFWLLGPLTPLLFLPFSFSTNRPLFDNMFMMPSCHIHYVSQIVNWACTLITYTLLWTCTSTTNTLELLYSLLIHTLLRISSIAIKYSTFSDYQLLMLETKTVETKDLVK